VPVILVRFWGGKTEFFDIFLKNTKMSDFIKFRPVGTDGRTDRQTDRRAGGQIGRET